uniref:Protein translocase subunit SecA n=1 Tax=Chondria tumulosa TaxID=2740715 RepID=A0A896SU90_9FLOR|nr:preprotein-translocase subunit a [Chondria tumulosa]QSD57054.1 preprotein-translocase subunit a [Chondria tumulosa]
MLKFLSNRTINKYKKTINEINNIYYILKEYPNDLLKKQTEKLKLNIRDNKLNTNNNLIEAFATVKEAIARTTGIVLFDVQLLGGIILHNCNIAEMKTGEGKTFVALLPAYLNCLESKGIHIITVNDYLVERDAKLAQKIFSCLNITIGKITQETKYPQRKKEYEADITYLTNSELGFDYLRDNMATHKNDIVQRNLNYAIIDEVDSILIDEARTPLIISGEAKEENKLYEKAKIVSDALENKKHYKIDEKSKNIILTEKGVSLCENRLKIQNLYNINSPWLRYIINALKAKELFIKNRDYIIKDNKIIIVDEFTGRIMEGRRWSDGLHQSIEAKEKVKVEKENKTLASITYQNLFLLYKKLCGITGTAKTEENEFLNIYKTTVIEIPTHKKCIRKDLPDLVYKSEYNKWQAIAKECFDMYQLKRPTLIGTTSIEKSELLASMLRELDIPYNLLNAKPNNIKREAEIVAAAGQKCSITISTNMAGRGTDIILGGNPEKILRLAIQKYIIEKNHDKTLREEELKYSISNILKKSEIEIISKYIKIKITEDKNIENIIDNMINKKNEIKLLKIYNKLMDKYSEICQQEKKEIIKLGGLYVIGTERHESRRIDNQLRGRSGRQGDRGTSRFFLSLQDNLFRIFGGKNIQKLMTDLKVEENIPIESIILSKSLNNAQKKVETYFYDIRKQLFDYDEVINNQRKAIYRERKKILNSIFTRDCLIEYGEHTIQEMIKTYKQENNNYEIIQQILRLLNIKKSLNKEEIKNMKTGELQHFFSEQFRTSYDLKEAYLEQLRPGLIRQLEKYYLLQQVDKAWQDHIDKMNLLKEYIGWRSYGQQDPLIEYKNEGFNLFINMIIYIRQTVIYLIMRSRLIININS